MAEGICACGCNGVIPSKRRLTLKQSKLVNGVADGKTISQAAQDAGYGNTPESARVLGSRELHKVNVSSALEEKLDRAGATLDASSTVISEAHKASITGKPDHQVRLKAAEMNLKARRLIGQSDATHVQNNFIGADSFEEFCRAYHRTRQQPPA